MTEDLVGRVLNIAEVVDRIGLSRASIYRLVAEGKFPTPIKLGDRRIGWRDSSINEWLQSLENETTQNT